jgi:hypothetical protein
MGINNRYLPSHPQGASAIYALDYSAILPPGVGIQSGGIAVALNTVPPTPTTELTVAPAGVEGRRVLAQISGGVSGHDYRIEWVANDTVGGIWPRTCLLLCAATS